METRLRIPMPQRLWEGGLATSQLLVPVLAATSVATFFALIEGPSGSKNSAARSSSVLLANSQVGQTRFRLLNHRCCKLQGVQTGGPERRMMTTYCLTSCIRSVLRILLPRQRLSAFR